MDNIQEKNNGKGVKVLLIVLIVLVLGLLSLECYKIFVVDKNNNDKKESNVVDNSNKNETNTNKNIPVEDIFAQSVEVSRDHIVTYTYILKDGKVYETKKNKTISATGWARYDTGFASKDITTETISLNEISGLPKIKRIKKFVSTSTGDSMGLLLVSESGEAYIYFVYGNENDGKYEKAKFLDNYKVDDIVSYNVIQACVNDGSASFKTCGGEYNIIDQNGNTQHYVVKTDGSLEKK